MGSIPASAGNPGASEHRVFGRRVHPRERGESVSGARQPPLGGGGSIPASAGNPKKREWSGECIVRKRVHPRERGESDARIRSRATTMGPSPRARGIRPRRRASATRAGSIPASAGNPPAAGAPADLVRVHPRERGESPSWACRVASFAGPSPRARGIPRQAPARLACAGSIPASAGNPAMLAVAIAGGAVHPRERGESLQTLNRAYNAAGPSPRARGIRRRPRTCGRSHGSIPASAGNPPCRRWTETDARVHPRERGESLDLEPVTFDGAGPSPRARGIPAREPARLQWTRSIPASAGNPASGS